MIEIKKKKSSVIVYIFILFFLDHKSLLKIGISHLCSSDEKNVIAHCEVHKSKNISSFVYATIRINSNF